MKRVIFCLVSLCVASSVVAERKLPSYVHICKRYDPDLAKCWENTIRELKPYLAKGIPEFEVPPISRIFIQNIHLDQSNTENVNFVADLYNLTFRGGEHFEVTHTETDFKGLVLKHGLFFPKLTSSGEYKAKGKVLLFEFEGSGKTEGEFENVTLNATWTFKLIKKKGKEYLQVDKDQLDVKPEKMRVFFHNLFDGNEQITKNVNDAINENIDLLYDELKPLLQTTMSTVLNQYFNRFYSLYPFDVLLPVD